jgi:hypothetical protein
MEPRNADGQTEQEHFIDLPAVRATKVGMRQKVRNAECSWPVPRSRSAFVRHAAFSRWMRAALSSDDDLAQVASVFAH